MGNRLFGKKLRPSGGFIRLSNKKWLNQEVIRSELVNIGGHINILFAWVNKLSRQLCVLLLVYTNIYNVETSNTHLLC